MATQTPEMAASPIPRATPPHQDAVTQTLALLQPWIDYVPKQQRRLGLFIFLALLGHLAVFFFIRIDTTRAELQHQVRTRVSVDNPQATSIEGRQADNFWDRLTDPRVFLLPLQPPTSLSSDEPSLDFAVMNSNLGTGEIPAAADPQDYRMARQTVAQLDQRVGEAMSPARQPFTYDEKPPVISPVTTWQWSPAVARRLPTGIPALPSPVSDTDLLPTELSVAIGANGEVEHVLVEQSCGSGRLDLDQQAVLAARKIRFQSVDQPGLLWGRITIFWHYAPQPRVEVVPTPSVVQ